MNTTPSKNEILQAELSMFDSRMPSDAPPVKESNARHALNAVQTEQGFNRTDLEAIKHDLVPHYGEEEANKIILDYTGVDMAQATPPVAAPVKTKPDWIGKCVKDLTDLQDNVDALVPPTPNGTPEAQPSQYKDNIDEIKTLLDSIKTTMDTNVTKLTELQLPKSVTVHPPTQQQTSQTTNT